MGFLFGRRRRKPRKKNSITRNIPFLRYLGPGTTLVAVVGLLSLVLTGRINLSAVDGWMASGDQTASESSGFEPVGLQSLGKKSSETIRIATFNIQAFGEKKSSDENVMKVIAQVISQFDVIAIQEVRGQDAAPIRRLVDLINRSGGRYTATVSEPIGRNTYQESYAFVWDENRIQMVPQSAYVVTDTADRMFREPMVASFQVRTGTADGRVPFRFTMINAHTSPSEVSASAASNEMDVLDDVFVSVRNFDYGQTGEEDFILLGDLNVDTGGLRELGQIPGMVTIAGDIKTNTTRSKTYDHILIDQVTTREFTGKFGVLDLQADFGLSEEQAIRVSDHLPVWAEFSAFEMPRFDPVASNTPRTIR